ncbi:sensor histidine kinase [Albidovulum sediminicola]|uniref:histidine kinase n=1 Tax=Albidovulum sediminicola TaxID=2984331 RepID=A0ABT2Z444_9RHOB|nr:ATP-binding protein [Defluviimonas sp. WL0075]MCV2865546.1 ATP-binding protein [Defluviimonas sp. WL0075]
MTGLRVLGLLAAVGLAAALIAYAMAERVLLADLDTQLDRSLILSSRAVESEIERLRPLPDIAAEDARIRAAVGAPRDAQAIDTANRYLEAIAGHSGADQLYLMDATGLTVAASNWNTPESFVGQRYDFRPYFKRALASGRGTYYGIGATTRRAGYFQSLRIDAPGGTTGVLVVKIELQSLQDTWRSAELATAVADRDGVIFLSGVDDWLYRPLSPLPAGALTALTSARTYDGAALDTAAPLLQAGTIQDAEGAPMRLRSAPIAREGWTLLAAAPLAPVRASARLWAAAAALVAALLTGTVKIWRQRHELTQLRLRQSAMLETQVAERTADLAREVEARKRTEADLRAAQDSLIQSAKMAALGRMSAAIVHEVSQPLAAMEATLAAADLTLPEGDTRTGPRIETARGLIRRMQRTVKNLKSFGRRAPSTPEIVDLRQVVANALEIVAPRARTLGVTPQVTGSDAPLRARVGPVRMEQVCVNLLLNALDAVAENGGTVQLRLGPGPVLSVLDTGPGIPADRLSQVWEPFFSTKTGGEGLGLGLSISREIVEEFGGRMEIQSPPGLGTEVKVSLPPVEDDRKEDAA